MHKCSFLIKNCTCNYYRHMLKFNFPEEQDRNNMKRPPKVWRQLFENEYFSDVIFWKINNDSETFFTFTNVASFFL